MYTRKYQRKRPFRRPLVTLLALVMLLSVCFPGLVVRAEDGNVVSVLQGGSGTHHIGPGYSGLTFEGAEEKGLTFEYDTQTGDVTITADENAALGEYVIIVKQELVQDDASQNEGAGTDPSGDTSVEGEGSGTDEGTSVEGKGFGTGEDTSVEGKGFGTGEDTSVEGEGTGTDEGTSVEGEGSDAGEGISDEGAGSEDSNDIEGGAGDGTGGYDGSEVQAGVRFGMPMFLATSVDDGIVATFTVEVTAAERPDETAYNTYMSQLAEYELKVATLQEDMTLTNKEKAAKCAELNGEINAIGNQIQESKTNGALTDDQYEALGVKLQSVMVEVDSIYSTLDFDDEENSEDDGAGTYQMDPVSIKQGESGTTTTTTNRNNWRVIDANRDVVQNITVTRSNKTLTITVGDFVPTGTYTVQYSIRNNNWTNDGTLTVTAGEPIKVYVYVATKDAYGNSWIDNEEFLELLGIGADTIDNNGYFPAGEIYLNRSFFEGKEAAAAHQGQPLITSQDDWSTLLLALSNLNTSTLAVSPYDANKGNKVGQYISQATRDTDQTWGSQRSALFRWNNSESYGFEDQTVEFHLDLNFNTNKITFITGNNGIDEGPAKDNTTVDSRVYITGSLIQEPRNLSIPAGYRFAGYFEDADFKTPWDGIGEPLWNDEIVYIKIVPRDNVVIFYKVAQGEGSLTNYGEGLNPETGDAAGSIATPTDGWSFVGWYEDEACTSLLSSNPNFDPTKPETGWVDGTTFYAKFVEQMSSDPGSLVITGEKIWDDDDDANNMRPTSISVTIQGKNGSTGTWHNIETQDISVDADGNWKFSFDVSDDQYTEFRVQESVPNGYTVEYTTQPKVSFTYPSTSDWDVINPCNQLSWSEDTRETTIVAVNKGNTTYIWTWSALTVGEQGLIESSLSGENQLKANTYVFLNGVGASSNGIIVTDSAISFGDPSNWSKFGTGTYSKGNVASTAATITNTLSTTSITLDKVVMGNMGSHTKDFSFKVTVNDAEVTDSPFSLNHNSPVVTIPNVPIGAQIVITESGNDGYDVTATVNGANAVSHDKATDGDNYILDGSTLTFTAEANGNAVVFTNTKNATIDTGITTTSYPFILLLSTTIVAGFVLLLHKRRYTGKF